MWCSKLKFHFLHCRVHIFSTGAHGKMCVRPEHTSQKRAPKDRPAYPVCGGHCEFQTLFMLFKLGFIAMTGTIQCITTLIAIAEKSSTIPNNSWAWWFPPFNITHFMNPMVSSLQNYASNVVNAYVFWYMNRSYRQCTGVYALACFSKGDVHSSR